MRLSCASLSRCSPAGLLSCTIKAKIISVKYITKIYHNENGWFIVHAGNIRRWAGLAAGWLVYLAVSASLAYVGIRNWPVLAGLLCYLVIINLAGWLVMYTDKRKAVRGRIRVRETTLFGLAFLGGGWGTMAAMCQFRHKTQKKRFRFGFKAINLINVSVLILAAACGITNR